MWRGPGRERQFTENHVSRESTVTPTRVLCSVTESHNQAIRGCGVSLQWLCGEAALRKPSGMVPPTGEGRRAYVVALPARVRLRNRNDDFLGEWWDRSDLPM